jgi:hypothetical protein
MSSIDHEVAASLAKALKAVGFQSDAPEAAPNPFWAAQEAFFICNGRNARAWLEMRESHTGENVPRAAYHGKLAGLCHRALRHPLMPDDLREPVAYAWGYFRGLLKAERKTQAVNNSASETDAHLDCADEAE